jgi:excisionase family DNA binding protein
MEKERIIDVNPGERIIINVKSDDDRNYSITEFAKLTGLSRDTVNRKIKNGDIIKVFIGKSPRIEQKYLKQFKK